MDSKDSTINVLIVASSAVIRRAINDRLRSMSSIQVVAISSSLTAHIDRLSKGMVDLLAVDEAVYHHQTLPIELQDCLKTTNLKIVTFSSTASAEVIADDLEVRIENIIEYLKPQKQPRLAIERTSPIEVIVIASSTGGPDALGKLLTTLPRDFETPILIVQHISSGFTSILARRLQQISSMNIVEASHGDSILPRRVLIAPANYHLEVGDDGTQTVLTQGPPENSCRPAADVLFRSAARIFGSKALGIVLTGMGRDGLEGSRILRRYGADVYVQDKESSIVWGMPGLVAREGLATAVLDIPQISQAIVNRTSPAENSTVNSEK